MSRVLDPIKWFYNEFGLASIHETGRNAYIIISARACRMFAHGAITLILALFFASLGFSDYQIGLFMTLTLLGDVFLGGFLTLIADRTGRRRILVGGSILMVMSGTVFAYFQNFWVLLTAAVFGVVSTTGGDFGPFRAIEESMLSHLTTPRTRADVLSWYVTCSTVGSAIGSEVSGRVVHSLQSKGWSLAESYHVLFYLYTAMGLINAGLTLLLTKECEINKAEDDYSQLPQDEDERIRTAMSSQPMNSAAQPVRTPWHKRISGRLSQISAPTLKIMYKLWLLLAVDSLADGMVPYSLTNYYMDEKFSPSKSTLGDVNSIAYFLGAISTVFSGPLARKIGLVNSMVFTHLPSSAAVLVFPAAPNLALTVVLLFVRAGLNNMDQPPRSAFIAGTVRPDERTATMGITTIVRTLAATAGPSLTGVLAGNNMFWIAFVVAGSCRLIYDVGLYVLFINVKLYQHEGGESAAQPVASSPTPSDLEEILEMDDLDYKRSTTSACKSETPQSSLRNSEDVRLTPQADLNVRRRSPSPLLRYP